MSEEAPKAEQKEPKAPSGGGGGSSKLVPIMLAVNSVLMIAMMAVVFLRPAAAKHDPAHEAASEDKAGEHGEKGEKGEKGKKSEPGPTLRLPDFVIHLRDAESERYARISFEIEVPDEKAKEAVTLRLPQIRDAFLTYLSDRTADELRGSEAISKVKASLSRKLGEVAPGAPIRTLYITELIVQ